MKLLFIADDLTGALDTAAQISKHNVKALVALEPGNYDDNCEALSVNLNMRHDSPEMAFRKTSALLRRFSDVPYIYLKTDSALRGNLSAAFAAVLAEKGGPAMFVPAYPKAARTTVGGRQFVDGAPLESSSFAQDPLNPMTTGRVTEILNMSHPVRCSLVPLNGNLPEPTESGGVFIFNSETQDQLIAIGNLLHAKNALSLTAGCAGFAEILYNHIPFEHETAVFVPQAEPVLFLSGSANKTTFMQLAHCRELGISVVKIPMELILSARRVTEDCLTPLFARLNNFLSAGSSVVLAAAEFPGDLVEIQPERRSEIQRLFALAALWFVRKGGRNLAIFGGDTAIATLKKLGCGCVRPLAEIQPGIALCVAQGLSIATKSGGLGEIDAVSAIDAYLRGK